MKKNFQKNVLSEYENVKKRTNFLESTNSLPKIFVLTFREFFQNRMPHQKLGGNSSRANWTYHVASCFVQTAALMRLTCSFEEAGKRDAIILNSRNEQIIVAEWEWNRGDIFGEGKELDKLSVSVKGTKKAALLLTYVPKEEHEEYLMKVLDFWQKDKSLPTLYFLSVLNEKNRDEPFSLLRTFEIDNDKAVLWDDIQLKFV